MLRQKIMSGQAFMKRKINLYGFNKNLVKICIVSLHFLSSHVPFVRDTMTEKNINVNITTFHS